MRCARWKIAEGRSQWMGARHCHQPSEYRWCLVSYIHSYAFLSTCNHLWNKSCPFLPHLVSERFLCNLNLIRGSNRDFNICVINICVKLWRSNNHKSFTKCKYYHMRQCDSSWCNQMWRWQSFEITAPAYHQQQLQLTSHKLQQEISDPCDLS